MNHQKNISSTILTIFNASLTIVIHCDTKWTSKVAIREGIGVGFVQQSLFLKIALKIYLNNTRGSQKNHQNRLIRIFFYKNAVKM